MDGPVPLMSSGWRRSHRGVLGRPEQTWSKLENGVVVGYATGSGITAVRPWANTHAYVPP